MKKFYEQSLTEVYENLKSSDKGLSSEEAKRRLELHGENVLKEKNKRSALKIFLSQFNNIMIIMLLLAGAVSLVYSLVTNESVMESIVIFTCVFVNIFMGFFQELKSENAIEALKTMTSSKAQVKRDGVWVELEAEEIVVGDVIMLEAGDKIPADARVIKCVSAKVDESILTGESIAVDKENKVLTGDKLIQDCVNIVYSGTSVANGKIEAIVIHTGMDTELGKIAGKLGDNEEELTPLQVKVNKVSSFITVIACFLIAFTFCFGLIKKYDALSIIMLCISMILASVPEVLPVSITATLTIGVQQMAKRKTIVKQMSAIETLGATQIICSDKTGTITTNQMTVVEIYSNEKTYHDIKTPHSDLTMINKIMALCNDNEEDVKVKGEFIGDPVEIALSKYLYNLNINLNVVREENKRINEIPFDSSRKMMSTINEFGENVVMLNKGSLSQVLEKSTHYYKNGKILPLSKHIISKFVAQEKQMSKKAYKVLAFAFKEVERKDNYSKEDENNFVLVGIAGMIDPPKDGVKEAVQKCKDAKMIPIMITGDSLDTAMSVAIEVGIAQNENQGIEGKKIDGLTDDELVSFVKKYTVFARVTPDHKVRIVRAFQASKKVVAMTGDGVNDAPALKLAHVGIGMGKAGSDVTKNVADIILVDDSFATIVTAVEEGRRIYNNVIRTILFNLSSNFAEIFLILFGMFVGLDIISPLHILYIDIAVDAIPSIALAFEKDNKNSMKQKPNGLNKRVFTPFMVGGIIVSAVVEVVFALIVFFVSKDMFGYEVAQTLALLSMIIQEIAFTYNAKDLKGSSIKKGLFNNKFMNISLLAIFLIQIPVFFTSVGSIFGLVTVNVTQFISIVLINILGFFVIELLKPLMVKCFKDK